MIKLSVSCSQFGGFTLGVCRHPFLIGVAGGTASGKTTVCDRIMQRLHDQCVVMLSQVRKAYKRYRQALGLFRNPKLLKYILCSAK